MTRPLDQDGSSIAALLSRAGLSARAAAAFAHLARGKGLTASELAAAMGAARQEAGDAARELELAGLARVEKVSSGGRPSHRYHLVPGGVPGFVEARRAAVREELAALDALAARFG